MNDIARTPAQIGAVIRRQRKRLGWNQSQLGQRASLRQETISLIENGHAAVRLDTLLDVLAALDLEFNILPRAKGADPSEFIG